MSDSETSRTDFTGDEVESGGGIPKVAKLVSEARICMLTTFDDGRLVSRPMAMQDVDDDGTLWFFVADDSPKAEQLGEDDRVNLSFATGSAWTSIAGRARLVRDRAKAEQLWNPFVEAWFPDGVDTPQLALLRVEMDSAEYWDTPGGRLTTLIAYTKAKVTGKPYEGTGVEHDVVES